jgi:hypothetical protein
MKRTKFRLPHAFAIEQLCGKGHSEPSYSLSSVSSSFMPSVDNVSSQLSTLRGPEKLRSTPEHSGFRDLLVLIQRIRSAPRVLKSAPGALPSVISNALKCSLTFMSKWALRSFSGPCRDIGGSPPPVKSTKASLGSVKLEVQRAYIVLWIFILLRVCDTYDKIQVKEMAWKCRVIRLVCENRHVYDCNLWFVYVYMTYVTQTLTVSVWIWVVLIW